METDREVNMLIAMVVTAINTGKKERRTNEFSRDVMRLKAELLTEKNQSEEYNRVWQWSRVRIEEVKSQLNERNETIRQEREKMAHLEKLYSELEKRCEWYGQMEIDLRRSFRRQRICFRMHNMRPGRCFWAGMMIV